MEIQNWLSQYLDGQPRYVSDILQTTENIAYLMHEISIHPDDAMFLNLKGVMMSRGIGYSIDVSGAIKLLQKAIAKGCTIALNSLAGTYSNISMYQDFSKAIDLFQQAIAKGHLVALSNLAFLYRHQPSHQDLPKAIDLYQQAIEKGCITALSDLADLYADQLDIPRSINLYQQASDKGDLNALQKIHRAIKNHPLESFQYLQDKDRQIRQLQEENAHHIQVLEQQRQYITELEYQPGGVGYCRVKQDFIQLIEQMK